MKKRIFILTLIFTFLFGVSVFADTPTYSNNWADWKNNEFADSDHPILQYNIAGQSNPGGYYEKFWSNADKCCIVKCDNGSTISYNIFSLQPFNLYKYNVYNGQSNTAAQKISVNYNPSYITNWSTYFGSTYNVVYYAGIYSVNKSWYTSNFVKIAENVDFTCTSANDLYTQLANQNFEGPKESVKFYLKTYAPTGMVNKTEYTITWDTTNSIVEDPAQYGIKVYVAKSNDDDGGILTGAFSTKKAIRQTDIYPVNLATNYFSFTIQELRDLYNFGGGWLDHAFWIYIQLVDHDSGLPVNNKWVTFHVAKIIEIVGSQEQTWNGNTKIDSTNLGKYENGQFEYTDGRTIGGTSGGNDLPGGGYNSNGSTVSQTSYDGGITNNTATTSQESGIDYGASLSDLSGNLMGLIQVLGNVPYVLTQICSFLPAWLITLISVSIGMIVVIGTAKLILR